MAADGGIINGGLTEQETAAGEYLEKVDEKYTNLAVTGHSLGGDLALSATIYSAIEMWCFRWKYIKMEEVY